jgi:uncharacterized protein (TIGR02611 family)
VGFFEKVKGQRDRQVRLLASEHIGEGEEILYWARARHLEHRRTGFIYITNRQVVIHWAGELDGHTMTPWEEIRAWGVDTAARGGPVLGIESSDGTSYVQMPAPSRAAAAFVTTFLTNFAEWAPRPSTKLKESRRMTVIETARSRLDIAYQRRTLAGQTKRVVITVVGIAIVILGIILLPLPGPGWLVIFGGLAVLAGEYDWAQDLLSWAREKYKKTARSIRARRAGGSTPINLEDRAGEPDRSGTEG